MDSLDAFKDNYNKYLVNLALRKQVAISGTFELLPLCNMKCKMCYIQQNSSKHILDNIQSIDFWTDIFRQAVDEGMLFPLITGGEPFLYPDFFKLYENVTKMGIHLCINTNATLLNRQSIAYLSKNPPRRLNISLYGSSEETYERLCQYPEGYEKVINTFQLLKEYNIPFRVHTVLVPENIGDYDGIKELCNKYRVPLNMTYYMFPPYRKEQLEMQNTNRFSSDEMAHIALNYYHDCYGGDSEAYRNYVYVRCEAMKNPNTFSLYNDNTVSCKAGRCVFWVDWKGQISGCGVHNQFTEDLHYTSFKNAWENIVKQTKEIRISENCKTCKYRCICPVCPAASFCETGDIAGVPNYICEFCEIYGTLLFKERMRLFEH